MGDLGTCSVRVGSGGVHLAEEAGDAEGGAGEGGGVERERGPERVLVLQLGFLASPW